MEPITLKVNEVEYVRKDSVQSMAPLKDGMEYVKMFKNSLKKMGNIHLNVQKILLKKN